MLVIAAASIGSYSAIQLTTIQDNVDVNDGLKLTMQTLREDASTKEVTVRFTLENVGSKDIELHGKSSFNLWIIDRHDNIVRSTTTPIANTVLQPGTKWVSVLDINAPGPGKWKLTGFSSFHVVGYELFKNMHVYLWTEFD